MEKVPDEHELSQNPMVREPQKQYVKDCINTYPQKVQDTPVLDSGVGENNTTTGNSLSPTSKIQGSKEKQGN
ncbi:hypothetical protein AMTRI_Chr13g119150 [Amborella trichopoda]